MKKNNRFSFIAVLLIAALVICGPMNARNAIAPAYAEETASHEILPAAKAAAQSLQMAEELESEGIVLLRNENGALPLAAGAKVNLFGYASVAPIYGGTGSGAGDTSGNVDVIAGLKNAGLEVNEQLADFYRNSRVSRIKQSGFSGSDFTPAEVPAASYPESLLADARAFSDTAVIVISRIGGEGGDLPMNMHAAGYTAEDE
ncbi:MAG: glycoside hydrolase family 3 C-terminal domain-containing protein, partial [Clostridia bacterium]|nr:glycoside hydrolase family 3 C-terminal domain-containing protein [Clostridia bacterium]